MQCPFCAETIQDAAVLCRFCGATRQDGQWQASAAVPAQGAEPSPTPGTFTLRTAGFLFLLSAGFELVSLGTAVPLFGEVRGGFAATSYHLLFAAVYGLVGIGLWRAAPWGYQMVMAGTGLYLADRLLYLLDDSARAADIAERTARFQQLGDLIDLESISQMAISVTLIGMACWIGFALYVHFRRAYFH